MGWRPEENDQEQNDRLDPGQPTGVEGTAVVIGNNGPADHDGHTACCPTPNHVLPGATLEPLGIDEDIEPNRQQNEASCKPGFREQAKPQHTGDHHDPGENIRMGFRNGILGQWTTACTSHQLVNVVICHHVEGVCRCRTEPATDQGQQHEA